MNVLRGVIKDNFEMFSYQFTDNEILIIKPIKIPISFNWLSLSCTIYFSRIFFRKYHEHS